MGGRSLAVATMCSGTESPLLALEQISVLIIENKHLLFDHKFSAEIVPSKQAYLAKNFGPHYVFRDVTELFQLEGKRKNFMLTLSRTTAYGGKAPIIGGLDLLVAGTCCVDFSRLNNRRKRLDDGGESGDTFWAAVEYCRVYRPKVLVFENVQNAPWKHMRAGLHEIGYASIHMKLDTKDFYIPHTRQRGYIIAIDIDDLSEEKAEEAWGLLEECATMVRALSRQASSPVEHWILTSDDPRLDGSITSWEQYDKKKRPEVQWEKCRVGYDAYRHDLALGMAHPITKWEVDCSFITPDFYQRNKTGWSNRVLDTIEVTHLRNLRRGFDDRFYHRIIEASQNVFRARDAQKQGIVACQTPNGLPILTTQGRRLRGEESLMLQGIPVDRLDLSRLGQEDLQHLAGNAMSSTVVGACIMAALIKFRNFLEYRGTPPAPKLLIQPAVNNELVHKQSDTTVYTKLSVDLATSEANLTRRLCFCEGRHKKLDARFQQCQVCRHTTCRTCGVAPTHEYVDIDRSFIQTRKYPVEFMVLLKSSLPQELKIVALEHDALVSHLNRFRANHGDNISPETWKMIWGPILGALKSRVSLKAIRRSEIWTATYESAHAQVVLSISNTKVNWAYYVNVSHLPLGSKVTQYLHRFPFARMNPSGDDITQGSWEFWLPQEIEFQATMTGWGPMVKSYENESGLGQFSQDYVFRNLYVQLPKHAEKYFARTISGGYELKQVCGQAKNTLHVHKGSSSTDSPLFFYLDQPQYTGNYVTNHHMVFTEEERRLEHYEHRQVIARCSGTYRTPHFKRHEVDAQMEIYEYKLADSETTFKSEDPQKLGHVAIHSDGSWAKLDIMSINSEHHRSISYRQLPKEVSTFQRTTCQESMSIFACETQLGHTTGRQWARNKWIQIEQEAVPNFGTDFSWLLERGLVLDGHVERNTNWQSISQAANLTLCPTCCPQEPKLFWGFDKNGKQVPFEDPEEATKYERTLKGRPHPISLYLHVNDEGRVHISCAINPQTLIHRAVGQLQSDDFDPSAKISTSWRLVTDGEMNAPPTTPKLAVQSSADTPPSRHPHSWNTGLLLRKEQLRALRWALQQENDPPSFTETEVVEARMDALGYRVEGRATREKQVRGGLLAFDVGFGKTVVILGLHSSQYPKAVEWAQTPMAGTIPVKATIIFVPSHLPDQWASEIEKFLTSGKIVLLIKTWANYKSLTVQHMIDADIIIVNNGLLENPHYSWALAQFSGSVEIDEHALPRAKLAWRKNAAIAVQANICELQSNSEDFANNLEARFLKNARDATSLNAPVPSRRFTGSEYVRQKKVGRSGNKRKREDEDAPVKKVDEQQKEVVLEDRTKYFDSIKGKKLETFLPLFEMFSFHRVVVDEYTYLGKLEPNLRFVRGKNHWVLSGTPKIGNFTDIKSLGHLLGVNLGIHELSKLGRDAYKKVTSGLTSAEMFLSYQALPSWAWEYRRYQQCEVFLKLFARYDEADVGAIDLLEFHRLLHQPIEEFIMYGELVHRCAAMDFTLPKKRPHTASDADQHFETSINGCDDAIEALLCRAAHPRLLEAADLEDENTMSVMKKVYRKRLDQTKKLEDILGDALAQAIWLTKHQPPDDNSETLSFNNWADRLHNNILNDTEATQVINDLVARAKKYYLADDWHFWYKDRSNPKDDRPLLYKPSGAVLFGNTRHLKQVQNELRTTVTRLNRQCKKFADHVRSTRFFNNVIRASQDDTGVCDGLECKVDRFCRRACILSKCGHLLCGLKPSCRASVDGVCPVCGIISRSYQIIPVGTLAEKSRVPESSHLGQKFDAIIDLLRNLPEGEKAIIFVQFGPVHVKVVDALKTRGITYLDLPKCKDISKELMAYQTNTLKVSTVCTGEHSVKALILDIDDPSASGGNLTSANHIIFVSPLYTKGSDSQAKYEATMTQAIGRARRFGQSRTVKSYHFVATNTIDADVLEHRNKQCLVPFTRSQIDGVYQMGTLAPRMDDMEHGPYSSAISHLLFKGREFD
ncbi:hypothetical protein BJ875DRAFT_514839 [Amylocarpus encephaloides]|uniref:Helicase ATP-binding domain-containing protein n=1 Tax=Amylocarpus encephaloides TaxID=45428 RepID=A0A9P7YTE4_9HELO|nr:hypothetical protein BJ875DRAFT_514839 [Amylocarpus encephaloides]